MKTSRTSARSVTLRIPASTSNLGPGYDTLGLAFKLYNTVRVTQREARGVVLTSPFDPSSLTQAHAVIGEAAATFFKAARQKPFGIEVSQSSPIPIARGLGSSVTIRLGVLAGLNELTGRPLQRPQILDLIAGLEHHPDNASPAVFGGFTVAGFLAGGVRCLRFPVSPKLKFVTLIPRYEVTTAKARQLVPPTFSRADTVHNLNRAALITAALCAGDFEALRGCFEDKIHQPYREKLIPQLSRIIAAGEKAGALGGWLSGSGPAVVCLTLKNADAVARAMQRQLRDAEVKVLTADNDGYQVTSAAK